MSSQLLGFHRWDRRPLSGNCTKIVMISDDAAAVTSIREALRAEHAPAELVVFTDAEDAMAFLSRQPDHAGKGRIGLMIIDMHQTTGGLKLLETIKADRDLRPVPVVLLTQHAQDYLPCYSGGPCSIAMKPLRRAPLRNIFSDALPA